MSCSNYISKVGNKCPDAFIINASLESDKLYNWEFTGKFNNKYIGEATTSSEGVLTIPVDGAVLSQDLFQPFSGVWELRLFVTNENGDKQEYLFCSSYEFIVLTFQDVTPIPEPNNYSITLEWPSL